MSRAVVIGAGPAGLTVAHELATRTDLQPIVLEATGRVGGISTTVEYRGNRIDIGGHRFFSKSDRVMSWWLDRLPLEKTSDTSHHLAYRGRHRALEAPTDGPDPHEVDQVMLLRERTSRILWHGRLYDYPLSMSVGTLRNLGVKRAVRSGLSYVRSSVSPVEDEENLEDFLINRFGRELYRTFFRSYTEKVWGRSCEDIPADWGAQRIKGLSIREAVRHSLRRDRGGVGQEDVETSLIERFLYPKYGPGQMWETVADEVRELDGQVHHHQKVVGTEREGSRITAVVAEDTRTGRRHHHEADEVFSSMPVPALVRALGSAPDRVRTVAEGLQFRDFLTVGLLVDRLRLQPPRHRELIPDNWIYVQEPDVQLGRLQVFNNWSPWMVADPSTVWLGLEYFCSEDDAMWGWPDERLRRLGIDELVQIGVIDRDAVLDGCVLRVPKAYPAYFGTYRDLDVVRSWLRGVDNLHPLGRNGQHRYNNQDHSMLTAMTAVDRLVGDDPDADVWSVNVDDDYHESSG